MRYKISTIKLDEHFSPNDTKWQPTIPQHTCVNVILDADFRLILSDKLFKNILVIEFTTESFELHDIRINIVPCSWEVYVSSYSYECDVKVNIFNTQENNVKLIFKHTCQIKELWKDKRNILRSCWVVSKVILWRFEF